MPAYTPIYRCTLIREGSVATEPKLDSTAKARAAANTFLADSPCEQFVVILLDTKHRVVGVVPITVGTLDASLVHPREVFRPALIHNVSEIITAHNHPSGDLTPSCEDNAVFRKLDEVGSIIGITCLNHIIVDGLGGTLSIREQS